MGLKIRRIVPAGMSGRCNGRAERSGSRRKASVILAVALAIAVLGTALPSASARPFGIANRGTEYVGATAGNNTGCNSPGYTSIQEAVDAASNGGTVYLCGSVPYAEPVIISNKRLTITGDRGATIQAPTVWPDQSALLGDTPLPTSGANRPQALVMVWGQNANATIKGLNIAGPFVGAECGDQIFGILVLGDATATITGNTITKVWQGEEAGSGCQQGVSIEIGRMYWPDLGEADFVGHATVTGNTIDGYQKNGMTVDGPGSSATVSNNTITGNGRVGYNAQNGIQFSRGASGEIRGNQVSGNAYTGTSTSASGILLWGGWGDPVVSNVQVSANRLSNNDVGISLSNYNNDGSGSPSTPTRNQVMGNMISNSAISNGIYQAGITDLGNQDTIMLNVISGVGYTGSANGVDIETIDTSEAISPRVFMNIVR